MSASTMTTKELYGKKVYDAKKGKKIGKVSHFVFHPSERRFVGFTVKRPDAALMFHRKDLFVAFDGYDLSDDGDVVVRDDPAATDKGACKALGVNWDSCVIWTGMPVVTVSGQNLGYVDAVTYECDTGAIVSMAVENGAANDVLLGKRVVPRAQIKGFKRGVGVALAPLGAYDGGEEPDDALRGAIVVADTVLEQATQGGVAEAAGKASAIAVDKARKGVSKAKAVASKKTDRARPAAAQAVTRTGEAINKGAYAAGKQLGRTKGMFAAFKEEFEKASKGEVD